MQIAKGSMFFKNTAILMAIFPIWQIASGFVGGFGGLSGLIQLQDFASATGLAYAAIVVYVIGAAVGIIVGIIGLKNVGNPDKMGMCILLGILVMLIYSASQIMDYVGGGTHETLDYIGMIAGLAIPAFYVVGAIQVKAGE